MTSSTHPDASGIRGTPWASGGHVGCDPGHVRCVDVGSEEHLNDSRRRGRRRPARRRNANDVPALRPAGGGMSPGPGLGVLVGASSLALDGTSTWLEPRHLLASLQREGHHEMSSLMQEAKVRTTTSTRGTCMSLVDTSVWIDHLRSSEPRLQDLLEQDEVCTHGLVLTELAVGTLSHHEELLLALQRLRSLPTARDTEVLWLIESRRLWGRALSPSRRPSVAALSGARPRGPPRGRWTLPSSS